MIRVFNKHYRKAIDLIEDCNGSEKLEMAEKVMVGYEKYPRNTWSLWRSFLTR